MTFIPGTGFRVVVSGTCQCAIDDRPFVGKAGGLAVGRAPGDCASLDPALFAFGAFTTPPAAAPSADLAPVPLPGAGAMLGAVVVAVAVARPIWRAMGALGDWFTSDRGTGPHQCGWV